MPGRLIKSIRGIGGFFSSRGSKAMKRLAVFAALFSIGMMNTSAIAQEKVLYLGSYGGSYETILKREIIPSFEREHKIKISYVSGNSTENLAKLQAQKGKQEIDVVIMDDGPMYQA